MEFRFFITQEGKETKELKDFTPAEQAEMIDKINDKFMSALGYERKCTGKAGKPSSAQ